MHRDEPVEIARAAAGFAPTAHDPVPREQGLAVTYRSTFEENWSVARRLLIRVPMMWLHYAMMGFWVDVAIAVGVARVNPLAGVLSLLFGWIVGVAAAHGILLAVTWAEIWFRTRGKERICTTSLTRNGVVDQLPGKKVVLAWSQICSIKLIHGAVVFVTFIGGCHVPASAFASEESRQIFMDRAVALWRSKGKAWPAIEHEAQMA